MAVSDFFLNMTAGLVTQYGLSAEALLVIVALFTSLGIGIFVARTSSNKDAGVIGFFSMFLFFTFIGAISLLVFSLPLISVAALYVVFRGKNK